MYGFSKKEEIENNCITVAILHDARGQPRKHRNKFKYACTKYYIYSNIIFVSSCLSLPVYLITINIMRRMRSDFTASDRQPSRVNLAY